MNKFTEVDIFFLHGGKLLCQDEQSINYFIQSNLLGEQYAHIRTTVPVIEMKNSSVDYIIAFINNFMIYNINSPMPGQYLHDNSIIMIGDTAYFIISAKDKIYQLINGNTFDILKRSVGIEQEFKSKYQNSTKRTDYISWEEYFMGIAELSARRSKDPNTQVGACIVSSDHKIVSIGYNGLPRGCSDDEFPWNRGDENSDAYDTKYFYSCHAELNAILNTQTSLRGTSIYVTLFPCNECAKAIIQSGIREVVYKEDAYASASKIPSSSVKASKRMFDAAGVVYRKYEE